MTHTDDAERELLEAAGATSDADHDEQVRHALDTASGWVGDTVSIVGVGALPSGEPCVVVHTTSPGEIPDDIDGVPVVVVVDDQPRALDAEGA